MGFIRDAAKAIILGSALGNVAGTKDPKEIPGNAIKGALIGVCIVVGIALLFVMFLLWLALAAITGGGAIYYSFVDADSLRVLFKGSANPELVIAYACVGILGLAFSVLGALFAHEKNSKNLAAAAIGWFVGGAAGYVALSAGMFHLIYGDNIKVIAEDRLRKEQEEQRIAKERQDAEEQRQSLRNAALKLLEDDGFGAADGTSQSHAEENAWRFFRSGDFERAGKAGSSEVSCKIGVAARVGATWASKYAGGQLPDVAAMCVEAAQKGRPLALTQLGRLFEKGIYFDAAPDTAQRFYRLAAHSGDGEAAAVLGLRAQDAGNQTEALELFLKGAEFGNAAAAAKSSLMLITGQGAAPDTKKGAELAELAVKLAIPGKDDAAASDGHMFLGNSYRKGDGRPKDFEQAIAHFQTAAKLGHPQANDFLKAATKEKQQADAERQQQEKEKEEAAAATAAQRQQDEQRAEAYRRGEAAMRGVVFATNRNNLFPASDAQALIPIEQQALEMNPGQRVGWTGPSNRSTGAIFVTRDGRNERGDLCKEFQVSISTPYSGREGTEVFCKVDGKWRNSQ